MPDRSTILTHLYGIGGFVPGLISIFYLIKTGSPWQEYALVASGWLAALSYFYLLLRSRREARNDGAEIAQLRAAVAQLTGQRVSLRGELKQRSATADYLASLLLGQRATPRAPGGPAASLGGVAPPNNDGSNGEPRHD